MVAAPYLPWWLAGLGLGALTAAQWLIDGRTLGVSGLIERAMRGVTQRERERASRELIDADPEALRAAFLAATEEELGVEVDDAPAPSGPTRALRRLVTGRGAAWFVLAVVAGGAIGALQRGTWELTTTLGPAFEARWGGGWAGVLALLGGGALVGFGTRMSGGCTSGHGLSGCSRLQSGSLVATAIFVGTAVVLTSILGGLG